MDVRFTAARMSFQNSVFKRPSGESPFRLGPSSKAESGSVRPSSKHAIVSLPSYMTPVCAGLHNLGDRSAPHIVTTFDIVRCCGGLDKHPTDEEPFLFKLEGGADSEFNDGSSALILGNVTRMLGSVCALDDFPEVKSVFELIAQDRASGGAVLRYELLVHWPAMRLKSAVGVAEDMMDDREAVCVSGRDRGGMYTMEGGFSFRG